MLAALNVHSKVDDLSSSTKRLRAQPKSYKVSPTKIIKSETPVVIRRSLRTRGIKPDASTASGLGDDFDETLKKTPKPSPEHFHPGNSAFTMKDAYYGDSSDNKLRENILGACVDYKKGSEIRVLGTIDLGSFKLQEEHVARVVPGRIMVTKFLPSADVAMIAVGNKSGNIGFWDVNAEKEDRDGIYLYRPHSCPVSGIVVEPFALSKVYTSCYDGYIRLMDVEKESFDLVHSADYSIFSMNHRQGDANSLYFSEGNGLFNIWDKREGKVSTSLNLHEVRINSLDFSSKDINIVATSSSDGTACIWDLRKMNAKKPEALKTINHKRAVHSAYFSPSGACLATTSYDDNVGLVKGANFEDVKMIHHNNQTGRWISSFRAIWGWDESYLYIGNMKRGVDVISTSQRRNVATLQSEHMSAIPCRFDAHPFNIGMLAAATSGGQIYIWTTST